MSSLIDKAKTKLHSITSSGNMSSLPKTYKAAVVEEVNAKFNVKDLPLELPKKGEVLVKVLACGVCGSDVGMVTGHMGSPFPQVPGHEIIGDVAAIPEGEDVWKLGDRVGGPWHGGHCGFCTACKRGQFVRCQNQKVNGVSKPGGFAEYVILRREAVVNVPRDVDPAEYAPILCAGVTVFNSLRNMNLQQGGLVGVQGVGGLGHLAIQYASKMGYKVVVLSSSDSKRDHATQLGARHYINQGAEDGIEALQKLGGADVIICTAGNPKLISPLTGGLAPGGTLLILAPCGEVPINTGHLIMGARKVQGWPSGNAIDSEEAIDFAKDKEVKCMVEKYPFAKVQEAYDSTASGKARFRSVLVME